MQFLFVFLFIGIIYAQEDDAYQELTNQVNQLSKKFDRMRIQINELDSRLASQESRIQTNEQFIAEINANVGNIDYLRIEIDELRNSLASQESRIQTNDFGDQCQCWKY